MNSFATPFQSQFQELGAYTSVADASVYKIESKWNTEPGGGGVEYDGIRPPFNKLVMLTPNPVCPTVPTTQLKLTPIPGYRGTGVYPLLKIQSNRQPYSVEHLVNKYPGTGFMLGTNLGV